MRGIGALLADGMGRTMLGDGDEHWVARAWCGDHDAEVFLLHLSHREVTRVLSPRCRSQPLSSLRWRRPGKSARTMST